MLQIPAIRCSTRFAKTRIQHAVICAADGVSSISSCPSSSSSSSVSGSAFSSALCSRNVCQSVGYRRGFHSSTSLSSLPYSSCSSSSSSASCVAPQSSSFTSLSCKKSSLQSSIANSLQVCPRRWITLRYNELDDRVRRAFFTVSYGAARALLMNPVHLSYNGTLTPQLVDQLSFQFRTWPNSPDMTVLVLTRGEFQKQKVLDPITPSLTPSKPGEPVIVTDADNGEPRDVTFCNGFDVQWMSAQMDLLKSQRSALEKEMNRHWQQQQSELIDLSQGADPSDAMQEIRKKYEIQFANLRQENLGIKLIRALQLHAAEMLYVNFPFAVAFDGETSSSGFALGILTRLRSVTENAVLRFDDAYRGLIPHGGASHVLSHLPYHFGFFLALTGHPMKGFQCVQSGLVPYYTPVDHVRGYLSMLSDKHATYHQLPFSLLEAVSTGTLNRDDSDAMAFPFASHMKLINDIFSQPYLSQIVKSFETILSSKTSDEFDKELAQYCLERMRAASPLALSVTFRLLRLCERVAPEEALNLEYRLLNRLLTHSDFSAAAKATAAAANSDSEQTKAVWSHATLEDVTMTEVDALFSPLYPVSSESPQSIIEAEKYELGAEFPNVRPGAFFITNETL